VSPVVTAPAPGERRLASVPVDPVEPMLGWELLPPVLLLFELF
jgi:hypothetical protein